MNREPTFCPSWFHWKELIASLAESILGNKARQELKTHIREISVLYSTCEQSLRIHSLEIAAREIAEEIGSLTGFSVVILSLYDSSRRSLRVQGAVAPGYRAGTRVPDFPDDSLPSGPAARSGKPFIRQGLSDGPRLTDPILKDSGARTVVCLPMMAGRRVVGTLTLADGGTERIDRTFYEWTASLANTIASLIERKSFEDARRASEERFRKTVVESPVPILIFNEDNAVLQISGGWTHFSGYEIHDIPTLEQWTKKALTNSGLFTEEQTRRLLENGENLSAGERSVRTKDGTSRTWEFYGMPLMGTSAGRRLAMCMAVDVTDLKRAEAREARNSARSEEDPTPVIEVGRNGGITYLTPAARKRFPGLRDLGREHPVLAGLELPSPDAEEKKILTRELHFDGRTYDQYVYFSDGGCRTYVLEQPSPEDCGERTRQLQKLSAVGQLTTGIAHEIGTPLGVILGYAQIALSKLPQDDPLTAQLKSIERESARCKDFLQELLMFVRVGWVEKEPCDVNSAVKSMLTLVRSQSKTKAVELAEDLDPDLPRIPANRSQIQEVVMNLCLNALDATGRGGTISVQTRSAESSGRAGIRLIVRDTGKGMPLEIQSRIFDPFFTTKEPGKGTGMGLSLVQEIVRHHGGDVDVASRPEEGTTFTVWLPA